MQQLSVDVYPSIATEFVSSLLVIGGDDENDKPSNENEEDSDENE